MGRVSHGGMFPSRVKRPTAKPLPPLKDAFFPKIRWSGEKKRILSRSNLEVWVDPGGSRHYYAGNIEHCMPEERWPIDPKSDMATFAREILDGQGPDENAEYLHGWDRATGLPLGQS